MKEQIRDLEIRDEEQYDKLSQELNDEEIDIKEYHKKIIAHSVEYRKKLFLIVNQS